MTTDSDDPRADPAFPALHGRPARGWVNDPNGLARVDGTWHVFFQHNPHAAVHDAIRWGHASSPDLLRWTAEPDALVPRPGTPDALGCWSGTLVDDGGVPTAVYSGVSDRSGAADVLLARSDRTLRTWVQDVVPVAPMPRGEPVTDVRDPFVFTHEGRRYAVQGAGHRDGGPRLLLWACDDLTSWELLGTLLDDGDPVAARVAPATVWECPNLVRVDGRWVLLLSLWRSVDGEGVLSGVAHLVGDLVAAGRGLRFAPTSGGVVDDGPVTADGAVFYAPQVLAGDDRVLLWGWVRETRPEAAAVEAGWSGCLTFPRELFLAGGALGSRPAAELAGLRRGPLGAGAGAEFRARAFELETTADLRLHLLDDAGEEVVAEVGASPARPARVLVDGSVVEVHAGPVPRTLRAYPGAGSRWRWESRDPAAVRAWELGLG